MLGYLCVLLIVKAVVVLLSRDVRLPLCIVDSQSCSSTALGYGDVRLVVCVLLMVKAVVVLLSWDVRLPLCIVDGQSCSNTALVGC